MKKKGNYGKINKTSSVKQVQPVIRRKRQTKLKNGKNGQCIKLPLSMNSSAGVHSALLNVDLSPCSDELVWMDDAPRYAVNDIKKILAVRSEQKDESLKRVVDEDIQIFGDIPSNVSEILRKCR